MNVIVRNNEVVAGSGYFTCYREEDPTKLQSIIKDTMLAKIALKPTFRDDQIKLFIDLSDLANLLPDSTDIITCNPGENLSEFVTKLHSQAEKGHSIVYDKRLYDVAGDAIFENDMAKLGLTGEYNRIRTYLSEHKGSYTNLIKTFTK